MPPSSLALLSRFKYRPLGVRNPACRLSSWGLDQDAIYQKPGDVYQRDLSDSEFPEIRLCFTNG